MIDQVTTSEPNPKRKVGRPATGRTTVPLTIWLPRADYEKLVKRVEKERWASIHEYARLAVLAFLNKKGQGTRAKERREADRREIEQWQAVHGRPNQ